VARWSAATRPRPRTQLGQRPHTVRTPMANSRSCAGRTRGSEPSKLPRTKDLDRPSSGDLAPSRAS
jgi:hypothetical protein